MKSTKEKKIKHCTSKSFLIYCMIISNLIAQNLLEQQLIGVWEIKYVKWDNSDSMEVPHYDSYQLSLERSNGKLIFMMTCKKRNLVIF